MSNSAIPQRLLTRNLDSGKVIPGPRTPFSLYYEDVNDVLKNQFPHVHYRVIIDFARKIWDELADKSHYITLSQLDKIRYAKEVETRKIKTLVSRLEQAGGQYDILQAKIIMYMAMNVPVQTVYELFEKLCTKGPVELTDFPPEMVKILEDIAN